jgi:hypothetical protein
MAASVVIQVFSEFKLWSPRRTSTSKSPKNPVELAAPVSGARGNAVVPVAIPETMFTPAERPFEEPGVPTADRVCPASRNPMVRRCRNVYRLARGMAFALDSRSRDFEANFSHR